MKLTSALHKYFGKKEGQTTAEFAAEIQALSESEKEFFRRELSKVFAEEIER